MHAPAILFATNAGVEPRPAAWPALERALWFGPLSPAPFRPVCPDADPGARRRASEAARAFNAGTDDALTGRKRYRELRRVLKAGGRFAFFDPIATDDGGPLAFPVPWAVSAETSTLLAAPETRAILRMPASKSRRSTT